MTEVADAPVGERTAADVELAGDPATPNQRKQSEPDPAPKRSGAPSRSYVVLQRHEIGDLLATIAKAYDIEHDELAEVVTEFGLRGTAVYSEVGRVDSRNSTNAIRRAFRELPADGERILAVVPESMWRPTPVKLRKRESVSVSIGD